MKLERSCGILLHPTMLPTEWGIGDLGPSAYRFIDFLVSAKQSYWQILPLTYPEKGNSPYTPLSSFAGYPNLISIDLLIEEGLISEELANQHKIQLTKFIDYELVTKTKSFLLKESFKNYDYNNNEFNQFEQLSWVTEFATFKTLYDVNNQKDWCSWDITSLDLSDTLAEETYLFNIFQQFIFMKQWGKLKDYAARKGISIIGDLPIYVSYNSSDVYFNRDLFDLDNNKMLHIAGVPPDYFNELGQVWDNPLYRWDRHEETAFSWWIDRIKFQLEMFDSIRLDHFIGFCRFWKIPAETADARDGQWGIGPKDKLFDALHNTLGRINIIAEDLGLINEDVVALQESYSLPGMKVLHFCLDDDRYNPFEVKEETVVYTGTHDNNTTLGWYQNEEYSDYGITRLNSFLTDIRKAECACSQETISKDLIELAYHSKSKLVIIPVQDLLNLDSTYRLNIPGLAKGNWAIRLDKDFFCKIDTANLAKMVKATKR